MNANMNKRAIYCLPNKNSGITIYFNRHNMKTLQYKEVRNVDLYKLAASLNLQLNAVTGVVELIDVVQNRVVSVDLTKFGRLHIGGWPVQEGTKTAHIDFESNTSFVFNFYSGRKVVAEVKQPVVKTVNQQRAGVTDAKAKQSVVKTVNQQRIGVPAAKVKLLGPNRGKLLKPQNVQGPKRQQPGIKGSRARMNPKQQALQLAKLKTLRQKAMQKRILTNSLRKSPLDAQRVKKAYRYDVKAY
jgi:hypothetical protein